MEVHVIKHSIMQTDKRRIRHFLNEKTLHGLQYKFRQFNFPKKDLTLCETIIAYIGWCNGTTTNPKFSCEKAFLRKKTERNLKPNLVIVFLSTQIPSNFDILIVVMTKMIEFLDFQRHVIPVAFFLNMMILGRNNFYRLFQTIAVIFKHYFLQLFWTVKVWKCDAIIARLSLFQILHYECLIPLIDQYKIYKHVNVQGQTS